MTIYQMSTASLERGRPPAGKATPSTFGEWLRRERLRRGWSSERMAEEIGLSQSGVSLYERGARRPRREKAVLIAEALGADPRDALEALMADTPGLSDSGNDARELAAMVVAADPGLQQIIRDMLEREARRATSRVSE